MTKSDDLENLTQKIQKQILERMRAEYTEEMINHWQNPRNFRRMEKPDGVSKVKGSCGDTMEIFLRMRGDLITDCSFMTDGCATTIACGSVATDLTRDKDFTEALAKITADAILKQLGGLPPADVHCAQLASEAVRRALADALYLKRSPWKKQYRSG